MKNHGKRYALVLLCIMLALSMVLVSCKPGDKGSDDGSKDPSGTTSTPASDTPGWDEENERWVSSLDPTKYHGENKKFRILVLGPSYTTYSSREFTFTEEDTLQSEVINDAAGRKNDYIKEHYGVEIVPIYTERTTGSTILELMRNDLDSNEGAYDAVMPYFTTLATLAAEGRLIDMAETNYSSKNIDFTKIIDFEKPWWDQSSINDLSIRDKVFFAAGDITLLNKVCTVAITFNRDIIENHGFESPYDLVDQGKWTLEKMYEMGKEFTSEVDGDGIMTYKDNWGLSSSYGDVIAFYKASGNHLATLDSNREPIISINGGEQVKIVRKVLEIINDRDWLIHANELTDVADIWETSLAIFGEGRSVFRTSAFSAVEKLKMNYSNINYGVVPMPKISEDQEEYYSYVSTNGTVSGIAMLETTPDPEFSAYMIEVNAVEGKNFLTPAYYDTVLKRQAALDEETARMLDLIFENTVYEVGRVYNFGGIVGILSGLVQNDSIDITSAIDSNKDAIEEAMRKVVEKFDEM